jgi:cyclohexyl-isocyanide hydratase
MGERNIAVTLHIGILLFPAVQQLDLTGPYEVFPSLPDAKVHLVASSLDLVTSVTGLILTPTGTFADCPDLDVLCIPGGAGVNALLRDQVTLDFVRRQAVVARYVTSVCTGALVLGAAGLLRGKRATTHWASHDLLSAFGAIPVRERVVRDGSLLTGGGVTAGIDFALTLAGELVGPPTAEAVQLYLEYAPAPPFNAGTPETAPPAVLEMVRTRSAKMRAEREALAADFAQAAEEGAPKERLLKLLR